MIFRNVKLLYVLFGSLFVLFLASCSAHPYILVDDEKVLVEVVDEAIEMQKGLMFREELCDNCGMIFVFGSDMEHSFWMKNTLIPLDMVFINSENVVVDVLHADPCEKDPCAHYVPKDKARYVLEVNKNTFDVSLIGTKVEIKIN
ncbi:DUF192 domain-containing protein [Candidatus Woesearchaeota archaeon]|jgi:uncharacterized membrane protein (UPF0127 family)|nr:DUF192 domain-containing protein [Candidatus Woesearchaeota archaeon]MBT6044479.1 DUF192 domain-containing protein [Candidatus Woesearchaeota archaeon]